MALLGRKPPAAYQQLVLTVIYSGLKATKYLSGQSSEAVTQFKKDLLQLKFPLPKNDNVSFVSHGCMKAFWITPLDSSLERNLRVAFNRMPSSSRPSLGLYQQADLDRLGIIKFYLDTYPYDPNNPQLTHAQHVQQAQLEQQYHQTQPSQTLRYTQVGTLTSTSGKRPAPQDVEMYDLSSGPNKRFKVGQSSLGITDQGASIRANVNVGPTDKDKATDTQLQQALARSQPESNLANRLRPNSVPNAGPASTQTGVAPAPAAPPQSNTNQAQIKQIEDKLVILRRELKEKLLGELNLYKQFQQIDPTYVPPRPGCLVTRYKALQDRLAESGKALIDSQKLAETAEKTLETERQEWKKREDEIRGKYERSRAELETRLKNRQDALARVEEELKNERNMRFRAEEGLQKERKISKEMEEELRWERKRHVEMEEDLRTEVKVGTSQLQEVQRSHVRMEEMLQSEKKRFATIQEELENERKSRQEVQEELQNEGERRVEMEDMLHEEREIRMEILQELQDEQRRRTNLEELRVEQNVLPELGKAIKTEVREESLDGAHGTRMMWQGDGRTGHEEVEEQLRQEQGRRAELEEQLQVERHLRVRAEDILKDVERECRAPFVVPALLEAFTTISNLTSQVLETAHLRQ